MDWKKEAVDRYHQTKPKRPAESANPFLIDAPLTEFVLITSKQTRHRADALCLCGHVLVLNMGTHIVMIANEGVMINEWKGIIDG